MAKIVDYKEIPLDDLVIGKGQARTQDPGAGIEDLARSIDVQGLLQPIVICPTEEPGKWEILTGQRRFLAHKYLKRETISAAILDGRVSEGEAKAISITENLIRRKLSGKELKDGILYLYNIYGSVADIASTTGLPQGQIRDNLKYPRLLPELKQLVDEGEIDVNVAVKAQDAAAEGDGEPAPDIAVRLAKEMSPMTGLQRKRFVKVHKDNPNKPIDEAIEAAKTGAKVIQVVATVTQDTHAAIQEFAKEENANQDEAVTTLIEESLVDRGLLEK